MIQGTVDWNNKHLIYRRAETGLLREKLGASSSTSAPNFPNPNPFSSALIAREQEQIRALCHAVIIIILVAHYSPIRPPTQLPPPLATFSHEGRNPQGIA